MTTNIKKYNINYIDDGIGDVIILLHGWGSDVRCFTNLIGLLKPKYRVIALDLPGFGESSKLDRSFNVDDYTDIVVKFIEKMCKNDRDIILLGHSYGGRIIIKLNSRNDLPFNIKKNILIDAAGIKDKKDIKTKFKISTYKTGKSIINILPINAERKNEPLNSLKSKFGSTDYKSADSVMQETLIKSVNEDLTPYLKNMKETLLIWGDKDTATPIYMAKIMEKEIKNAGLVVLKGGHFSFIDDPFTFTKVMASYLKL